jgi:transcription termination factor NusB
LEDNLLKCLKPVEKNVLRPHTYSILLYNKIDRGNALKKTIEISMGYIFVFSEYPNTTYCGFEEYF